MYGIPTYRTELSVADGWIVRREERVIARGFRTRKLARQYIQELKEWYRLTAMTGEQRLEEESQ